MIRFHEAKVNVTWAGQNGDLPDPVHFETPSREVLQWAAEAVRSGGIPGIARDHRADFRDFVVDRFRSSEVRPYNLISIRPKTPFGACNG